MAEHDCNPPKGISRRQALLLAAASASGIAAASIGGCAAPGRGVDPISNAGTGLEGAPGIGAANALVDPGTMPFPLALAREIERVIKAKGTIAYGLLQIGIDRDDIRDVTLHGVPISPAFEINGDLNFQYLGGRQVTMNSDLCLKTSEVVPFLDRLLEHNIVFQAEHQHFYDFDPLVWFIHFRATGEAARIAAGVKAALNATSTPFPQAPPANPKTPLPAAQLGKIIGAKPSVGAHGVVSFQVPRAETIYLGGIRINPYLNVSMPVLFQPLANGRAAAVPDFGMIPSEIQKLVGLMRNRNWDIGCLYNQETDERPQLFFSHQFKTGDPIVLAHEIRDGLNLLNVRFVQS